MEDKDPPEGANVAKISPIIMWLGALLAISILILWLETGLHAKRQKAKWKNNKDISDTMCVGGPLDGSIFFIFDVLSH